EIAARAVLVLVRLAEPLELGRGLPPQPVHLRLLVGGRALGGRGGRPGGGPRLPRRLRGGRARLSASSAGAPATNRCPPPPRARVASSAWARSLSASCAASVSRSAR